jgi:hypothetical protein
MKTCCIENQAPVNYKSEVLPPESAQCVLYNMQGRIVHGFYIHICSSTRIFVSHPKTKFA